MAPKREKAPGLAVLIDVGKAKPKSAPKSMMGMMGEDEEPEDDVLDPDFEESASEAFPDLGSKQLMALQRAIRAVR